MTDHDPNSVDPQTRDLRAALSTPEPPRPRDTKNMSPLVWIVLILLIGLGVFAWTQYGGGIGSPSGDAVATSAPMSEPADATTPASQ